MFFCKIANHLIIDQEFGEDVGDVTPNNFLHAAYRHQMRLCNFPPGLPFPKLNLKSQRAWGAAEIYKIVQPRVDAINREFAEQTGKANPSGSKGKLSSAIYFEPWTEEEKGMDEKEQADIPLVVDTDDNIVAAVEDVEAYKVDMGIEDEISGEESEQSDEDGSDDEESEEESEVEVMTRSKEVKRAKPGPTKPKKSLKQKGSRVEEHIVKGKKKAVLVPQATREKRKDRQAKDKPATGSAHSQKGVAGSSRFPGSLAESGSSNPLADVDPQTVAAIADILKGAGFSINSEKRKADGQHKDSRPAKKHKGK